MSHLNVVHNAKDIIKNALEAGKLPWTPRAQAVLKYAEKQARKDGFEFVGTEHLIFGMLSIKECLGAKVLNNLGVTESEYIRLYEPLRPTSPQKDTNDTKFAEEIDKVIQRAIEQSTQWGHTYIGAEHLLTGTLMARAGQGYQILVNLGVTLDKARDETAKLIVCHDPQTERTEK